MKILKKGLAILLCLAMMLSVVSIGAFAEGEDIVFTFVANSSALIGGQLTVDVYAGSTSGSTVKAAALTAFIWFDQSRFANDATVTYWNSAVMTEQPAYDGGDASKMVIAGDQTSYDIAAITDSSKGTKLATFTLNVKSDIDADAEAKSILDSTSVIDLAVSDYANDYDDFTVGYTTANVKVIDQTTITAVTDATVNVPYGSDLEKAKAMFPATVKGSGTTAKGSSATDVDVNVTWDFSNFTTAPTSMENGTVTGTLSGSEGIVVNSGLKANAVVTYAKATDGVVAPVEVKVMKKADGAELTSVADIVALDEVKAVTATTVKNTNGAQADVTINYTSAEFETDSATSLDTGADSGSVVLEAPVTTESAFYDVSAAKATITVTMVPAEVENCTIKVSGTTQNSKPTVTVTIPVGGEGGAEIVAGKEITVEITNDDKTYTAKYIITEADVASLGEDATSFTAKVSGFTDGTSENTLSLKSMGFSTGDEVAMAVKYDGAALLSDKTNDEGVIESKVQATSNPGGTTGTITPGTGSNVSSSYTVKVADTENGTVKVSAATAKSGESITVDAAPAEGYVVKSIAVADASGNAVAVSENVFVMPAADVVVTVVFAAEGDVEEQPADFADVPAGHWAAEAVNYLKEAGAVNGKTATEFDPDGQVTRAEFTKMFVSLLGIEGDATEVKFVDCGADDWFTPYVAKAVASGLVNGVSETEFAPDSTITREDVCTIIGRYLAATTEIGEGELTFTDAADVAEYAVDYVAYLAELGIVNGYEDGSFAPKANITRAEAAKVLYGLVKDAAAE